MSKTKIPSEELLAARRDLEDITSVKLLHDWIWSEEVGKWILHCRIHIHCQPNDLIQPFTDWYVLVDQEYPWGIIDFYPAKQNGIIQTFPHQHFNGCGSDKLPWRNGKICLTTGVSVLDRHGYDIEPHDFYWRLSWYFERAIQWLIAASQNQLVLPGDPFELPYFPTTALATVAFSEGVESFAQWQDIPEQVGLVELVPLRRKPNVFFVKSFLSIGSKELFIPTWGKSMASLQNEPVLGIWLRIKEIPVLKPWQVPSTWQELRETFREQEVEIDELLKLATKFIRDAKTHFVLVGFPIPAEVGASACQIYWQALQLPVLSQGTKTAKGFRTNEQGYWRRDRTEILRGSVNLCWANSENWHIDQISTRGRLPDGITSKKILLLGAGAVGSVVAEALSRSNAQKITILDADKLEIGNLTRHTLDRQYLKVSKAAGVANRLNLASPHATIEACTRYFPFVEEKEKSYIREFEIILDCTGSDTVLYHLETFSWLSTKLFVSISLGMGSKRLFCFAVYGESFPSNIFKNMINPWLQKDIQEYEGQQLPRAGIGCWHPVFPARVDDVWMMASVAVKHLETLIVSPPRKPHLAVFEQVYENGNFCGVHCVCSQDENS